MTGEKVAGHRVPLGFQGTMTHNGNKEDPCILLVSKSRDISIGHVGRGGGSVLIAVLLITGWYQRLDLTRVAIGISWLTYGFEVNLINIGNSYRTHHHPGEACPGL